LPTGWMAPGLHCLCRQTLRNQNTGICLRRRTHVFLSIVQTRTPSGGKLHHLPPGTYPTTYPVTPVASKYGLRCLRQMRPTPGVRWNSPGDRINPLQAVSNANVRSSAVRWSTRSGFLCTRTSAFQSHKRKSPSQSYLNTVRQTVG